MLDDIYRWITQVWVGPRLKKAVRLTFRDSNNEAEYKVAIHVLGIGPDVSVQQAELYIASRLLASQYGRTYEAKDEGISAYLNVVQSLAHRFISLAIIQKPRYNIRHDSALAYLAVAIQVHSPRNIVDKLQQDPSISLPDE